MKQKLVYVLLGALICFSCVTMMGTRLTHMNDGSAANLATSDDGKYVYIIGAFSNDYFRSEDFGKTFENFDIEPED